MPALTISLDDSVRPFVEARVTEGGYRDAAEYVHALIHAAEQERVELEEKLRVGLDELNRGEGRIVTAQDWKRRKDSLLQSGKTP